MFTTLIYTTPIHHATPPSSRPALLLSLSLSLSVISPPYERDLSSSSSRQQHLNAKGNTRRRCADSDFSKQM